MSFSWPKQGRFKARLLMRFSYKDGWPSNANLSLINPPLLARHLTREKNSPCTSIRNKVLSPPILSISKKTISPVRFPSFFLIKVCNPQTLFLLDSSAHGSRTSLISLYYSCHSCHLIPDGFPKLIAAKLLGICKSDVCIHGHILSSVRFDDLSVFIFIPEMQLSSSYLWGQPVLMNKCTQLLAVLHSFADQCWTKKQTGHARQGIQLVLLGKRSHGGSNAPQNSPTPPLSK